MKPTSIIFIILSAILIVAGLITCLVAGGMAEKQGIALFSQVEDESGNLIYTCEIDSDKNTTIIDLNISNADIVIQKGSEDKIVLVNFTEGSYSRGISNGAYTVDDKFSLSHLFTFDEGGFSFSGLRQYFHNFSFHQKDKQVNVFLTEETKIIKIKINLKKGDLNINDIVLSGDFDLNVSDGNIRVNDVYSSSRMSIVGNKCNSEISGGYIKQIKFNVQNGSLDSDDVTFDELDAKLFDGDIQLVINDDYNISAQTQNGNIIKDNTEYGNNCMLGDETIEKKIEIQSSSGNIYIDTVEDTETE